MRSARRIARTRPPPASREYLRPAVAGLLMEKELDYLGGALENPKRPFIAILGGSKISGKIDVIEPLLPKVDALLIGGAMACTFYKAMGLETGKSLVEAERVELRAALLDEGGDAAHRCRTMRRSRRRSSRQRGAASRSDAIPADEAMLDIGPRTAESYARAIASAKTVLWNGPMGVFETPPFDKGTRAIADAMANATARARRRSSAAAIPRPRWQQAGLADEDEPRVHRRRRVARVSGGEEAPGVEALDESRMMQRKPVLAANWKMNTGRRRRAAFIARSSRAIRRATIAR